MKKNLQKTISIKDSLPQVSDKIDALYVERDEVANAGIKTGLEDLDFFISGLNPGDLIVVAGRPAVGKSSFACAIAMNAAINSNAPVAFFSMEMNAVNLTRRLCSSLGGFSLHHSQTGNLEDEEWVRLTSAMGLLNNAPIVLIDTLKTAWNANAIEQTILELDQMPSILVIDGLQMLDVMPFNNAYDRNIQLGEQVRLIKKFALKHNITVILTSPLNRELEARPDKRPVLKDIRDVGMLEDVADVILFIYRDDLYDFESDDKGTVEIIIAKNRNAPHSARIRLLLNSESMRYFNYPNIKYV